MTSLGVFIVLLDTAIINIAFPAITTAFPSTSPDQWQLLAVAAIALDMWLWYGRWHRIAIAAIVQ